MSEEIDRALDNLKGTTMALIRNLRSFGIRFLVILRESFTR
jgi:hypothetical protein